MIDQIAFVKPRDASGSMHHFHGKIISTWPGSLVVVWPPRSNTARRRAVSLSEYRWNRKSRNVPNRVTKCHSELVNLKRGEA